MSPWELDDLRHDLRRFVVEHPMNADERKVIYAALRLVERSNRTTHHFTPAQENP